MPETADSCLISISGFTNEALKTHMSTILPLYEALKTDTGASIWTDRVTGTVKAVYQKCAHSGVYNYLGLLLDQASNELKIREHRVELEGCHQILAEMDSRSQEKDEDSERQLARNRLLEKMRCIEELIGYCRRRMENAEAHLSALAATQIEAYLDTLEVAKRDPVRPSRLRRIENVHEPSPSRRFKDFAAETFGVLVKAHPHGVSHVDLQPFADECDARGYMPDSDFLTNSVCQAIKQYNDEHPGVGIKNFSDVVAVLGRNSANADSVKKRQKNSTQKLAREFRKWLSYNKSWCEKHSD